MARDQGLAIAGVVVEVVALVLLLVSVLDHNWFRVDDTGCTDGLYTHCCSDVCNAIVTTSPYQESAKSLAPMTLLVTAVSVGFSVIWVVQEDDGLGRLIIRAVCLLIAACLGAAVTGVLAHVHSDEIGKTMTIRYNFWLFLTGWILLALDILIIQLWGLINFVRDPSRIYTTF